MNPFLIFPWDKPFLQELQHCVAERTASNPGQAIIIVPHNRPRRYLREFFRQDTSLPRPMLLPRMLTVSEMIGLFRAQTTTRPLRTAAALDRVALLYRCVQDVANVTHNDELCQRFAGMDMARFFPWGLRLSSVLEECLTQQLEARDIPYTEGEVSPLASALLGALGRIHARYMALLEEEGWTTPGLDAFIAARHVLHCQKDGKDAEATPLALRCSAGENARQIFIAGLAVLSDAENTLLHHLWQHGAHICLHTDPALAQEQAKNPVHWACTDHVRWMRQWQAKGTLACAPSEHSPQLHFMAGYDVHSQLLGVREVLCDQETDKTVHTAEETPPSTAIVLAQPGLLMPMLHHLPDQDFNVSMGYPLERAPLCGLVEAVLRLQAAHKTAGHPASQSEAFPGEESPSEQQGEIRYHWRALLQCLRHPYVQMLACLPEDGISDTDCAHAQAQPQYLRPLLHRMEERLRGGTRFAAPLALAEDVEADFPAPLRALLRRTLTVLTDNFATARTPAEMGTAIGKLCDLLLAHGEDMWKRYPLDAESLYRLVQHVIPGLRGSALADTPFPPAALSSLTRQLLRAERVPFEADPIAGLQILGMLETRLLHFERLLIVDATDENLPGFTAQDPLLPDALRALLGLPDAQRRERTSAHTLFRLMAGAREVHFFWQEGIQRSALFDGKSTRSRFVDELIWQEEQKRGALLHTGTPPLRVAPCPVRAMPREAQGLPVNDALRVRVREWMDKGISPTRLDTYLQCPLRFAFESLYNFRPLEEVNEGDDPMAVGELIHRVLHTAFTPWLGRPLNKGSISPGHLDALFAETLKASSLRAQLPPDSYTMLSLAGPLRLRRFLEQQPEETQVIALEKKLSAPLVFQWGKESAHYLLKGTLDRVDVRQDIFNEGATARLTILDYKTGQVRRPAPTIWSDTEFWQSLPLTPGPSAVADALLQEVSTAFPSVQLPCYLYLCSQNTELTKEAALGDAAWVALRDNGAEVALLGGEVDEDLRDVVLEERIPTLLAFLLRHMEKTECFSPHEGTHCQYCPYTGLCKK